VIHGKGTTTITGSAKFLESYSESLMIAGQRSTARQDDKGKGIVYEGSVKRQTSGDQCRQLKGSVRSWLPPQNGWVKLNVDAGFCPTSGASSLGVIARNEVGAVLLTAWK
jgi:hypothetical protein